MTPLLPSGLPIPQDDRDGLYTPFWEGLRHHEIRVPRCEHCGTWQWLPEWFCAQCHQQDMRWQAVAADGQLHSFTRVWHPTHPSLHGAGPYYVGLIALPGLSGIRMIGNLAMPEGNIPQIGQSFAPLFEDHVRDGHAYTLLQWSPVTPNNFQ